MAIAARELGHTWVALTDHSPRLTVAKGLSPERLREQLAVVKNPLVNVLGHCTGRIVVGRGRPESTFDADAVFSACAAHDVAVEINSRPERLDPPKRLLAQARDLGCTFVVDTDAHAPGQLEWQPYGCDRAAACEVPAERIKNTLPLDGFLAWTHAKR
jgi:putative hydrolase